MSIGLSDMIELYLNPTVHREHNCPDIMRIPWKDYNGFHAMWSGIKCSWFLILPLCLFKHNLNVIFATNIINISIPVFCFITGWDKLDPYYAHKMLYLANPIMLFMSIFTAFFKFPF